MWGTDMTATVTVGEGAAFVFVAVDPSSTTCRPDKKYPCQRACMRADYTRSVLETVPAQALALDLQASRCQRRGSGRSRRRTRAVITRNSSTCRSSSCRTGDEVRFLDRGGALNA